MNTMINKVIDYCKENNIEFIQNNIILNGLDAELIEFTQKKIFTKRFYLYFIECNEFDKIESICSSLADDKELKGVNLALFCKTTLEMTEDNICFIGENGTQFVYCVYQNTNSNKFTYFLKDLNMPKTIRNIIKSVVGE